MKQFLYYNIDTFILLQPISIDIEHGFHCVTTPFHTICKGDHEYDSVVFIHFYEKVWLRNRIRVQSQLKLAV